MYVNASEKGRIMVFNQRNLYVLRTVFLSLFLLVVSFSHVDAADRCVECHKDVKFRTENRVLFNYYNDWKDSIHEISSVSCPDCHGGNPAETDKEAAHTGDFSSLSFIDKESNIPQRCGKCHKEVLNNFVRSKHYKSLLEKGTGPHCVTCHGAANSNVYYTSVITNVCKGCHNAYTENLPGIVGEADKILHRINVSQSYERWVLIYLQDDYPSEVEEILGLYTSIAESWHEFDFKELDQRSRDLLNKIQSLVNKSVRSKKQVNDGK